MTDLPASTVRGIRSIRAGQLPALVMALLIAEQFYKFHSFTLECLAFLATWWALDEVTTRLARWSKRRSDAKHL